MTLPRDAAALIDEFGELSRQIEALKPSVQRHKALAGQIQEWLSSLPADESAVLDGGTYSLQASPREQQTSIRSMQRAYRALGLKAFLQVCSVTLKALREHLEPAVYDGLVETHRTGLRTLKAVAKAPAVTALRAA